MTFKDKYKTTKIIIKERKQLKQFYRVEKTPGAKLP